MHYDITRNWNNKEKLLRADIEQEFFFLKEQKLKTFLKVFQLQYI